MTKRLRKKKRTKIEFLYMNAVEKHRKVRNHIWNRECKRQQKSYEFG